ncbi:hypothetical protein [Verrucosispora sp. TAA-831]|uniref:hypothetical protein n=1 Tax=Verrucosispora sp. TAA-831 TaxID=3422227 RepID=UPI003D6FF7EC
MAEQTTPAPVVDEFDTADGFDLDAAYAAEQRDLFRFRWRGEWWTVPHLGDITDWRLIAKADSMDMEAMRTLLTKGLGDQAERFGAVDQYAPAMMKLFDRWLLHSGMAPGEAPGSDDSSPEPTEEPSPPTSTPSTTSASAKPSSGRRKTASRSGS